MYKIDDILRLYNSENKTLQEIALTLGTSKSTVQKTLSKGGYKLNRKLGIYENNSSNETSLLNNNVSEESNVSRETIVNRTYAISESIDRAIKIKSAIEGIKPIDIVRNALESYIEDKYKTM